MAVLQWELDKEKLNKLERKSVQPILSSLTKMLYKANELKVTISTSKSFVNLWEKFIDLSSLCKGVLKLVEDMEPFPVRPVIAEYTDAGPGVGVKNLEVRARFAE